MKIIARDEYAQKYIHDWEKIESPQENFREMCYYHKLKNNVDGSYTVGIDNNRENLFLRINYNSDFLDKFVQWKMFGKGEYVSGLEPCSSTIDGRANARFNKTLKFIEPKQTIFNNFCITISDDKKEVASL